MIMKFNKKVSAKVLGTVLILGIVGTVYTSVAEPGSFLLSGSVGLMGTTLLWSD